MAPSKKDFLVGLFVIVAIIALAGATMVLRHWDLFNKRNTYYVRFNHVKQLDIGSPVLAYGVNVGTVSNLEYDSDAERPIKVTIAIDKKVQLFSNAQMHVHPAQVIGSTTLIIDTVGNLTKDSRLLPPGSTINGYEPPGMDTAMNEAFQGLSKLLNDQDTQAAFKRIMMNLESVTKRMDETFRMINEGFMPMMQDLQASSDNLNKLLTEAQAAVRLAANNVSSASQSISRAGAEYSKSARTLDQEFVTISKKLQGAVGQLQTAIANNEKPLGATMDELRATSRSLREIVDRVNSGEGTLGKLITDPRPFQQLEQLIDAISRQFGMGGPSQSAFPQVKTPPPGRAERKAP